MLPNHHGLSGALHSALLSQDIPPVFRLSPEESSELLNFLRRPQGKRYHKLTREGIASLHLAHYSPGDLAERPARLGVPYPETGEAQVIVHLAQPEQPLTDLGIYRLGCLLHALEAREDAAQTAA